MRGEGVWVLVFNPNMCQPWAHTGHTGGGGGGGLLETTSYSLLTKTCMHYTRMKHSVRLIA